MAKNQTELSDKQKAKFVLMSDGKDYQVISEDGKYFYCKNTQFRKSNPSIVKVYEKNLSTKKTVKTVVESELVKNETVAEPPATEQISLDDLLNCDTANSEGANTDVND